MEIRLNHFILWCKNWYPTINDSEDIFESALKILKLDGYDCATKKHVIPIALNFIDDLMDNFPNIKNKSFLRLSVWNNEIQRMMTMLDVDYQTALLYTIKHFFEFEITSQDVKLKPPKYSRKLFKMGFVPPKHFGNSYKLANYKVNKFFNQSNLQRKWNI